MTTKERSKQEFFKGAFTFLTQNLKLYQCYISSQAFITKFNSFGIKYPHAYFQIIFIVFFIMYSFFYIIPFDMNKNKYREVSFFTQVF